MGSAPGSAPFYPLSPFIPSKFSFLPLLSWDVGISAQGPVISELNTRSRWTSVQRAIGKGLLSRTLGEAMFAHRGVAASGLRFDPGIVHGIRTRAPGSVQAPTVP